MDKEPAKNEEPAEKNSDHNEIQMETKDQVFDTKGLGTKKKVRKVKTEEQLAKQETKEDYLTEN